MTIEIRKVTTDDAEALSALFTEFIGKDSDVTTMREQLELLRSRQEYYVAGAYRDQELIGTAMGIACIDLVGNGRPFLLIENVVVSPFHQGVGIGKKLMQALEDFGRTHECNYLILASSNERIEAHRFYENLGFAGAKRGFIKYI
ncbi:GNAT family N-acetyltransferase [Paenibacillus sp. JCM 10914]|uniref:GNAT family N-acetyltransferase n=1 Tax=Paenibacillus sp. JCM 10914 TaxID=1236974 RepID=UPI0003CCABD1|nr:GNAT family N-acetyltransferase [Paenibacillus sp. JCM 10914]GAE06863.1 hypothetical protein JCM10914_3050 [Paenibacillus sp. JCM 10914]